MTDTSWLNILIAERGEYLTVPSKHKTRINAIFLPLPDLRGVHDLGNKYRHFNSD
jgi:hypothetical protein